MGTIAPPVSDSDQRDIHFPFLTSWLGPGLELQISKGTHFKAILKGQLRAPRHYMLKKSKSKTRG